MQIALCLQDVDLDDNERFWVSASLLFGNGLPPVQVAADGLAWFMRCGQDKAENKPTGKQMLWFDFDAGRIFSSFRQTYGIELHKAKMHWFEFVELLGSLNEDSALSHAMQVRGRDTSQMKGKQRADFEKLKQAYTPPVKLSEAEQAVVDEFWAQFEK